MLSICKSSQPSSPVYRESQLSEHLWTQVQSSGCHIIAGRLTLAHRCNAAFDAHTLSPLPYTIPPLPTSTSPYLHFPIPQLPQTYFHFPVHTLSRTYTSPYFHASYSAVPSLHTLVQVVVGDIIKVTNKAFIPADLLLLTSR